MSITYKCYRCGKEKTVPPSVYYKNYRPGKRHFCSRQCNMQQLNEELNPERMTNEVRKKVRLARLGTGEGKTYTKEYGRHEHRIAAEKKLGRPLKKGEVVHHIDSNKRNNDLSNLMVFPTQAEHAIWHAREREFFSVTLDHGEVMPL